MQIMKEEYSIRITTEINQKRKQNKNKWYYYSKKFYYQDKEILIQVKGFNTWLQVLRVNGAHHDSNMGISATEFCDNIQQALEYHM